MSNNSQALSFEKMAQAPVNQAYLAFINSNRIREWMCDVATTDPKLNGRIYLGWNGGFYACGHFTHLEKDHMIGFTWYGRGEPRSTQVMVTLSTHENGVHIQLEHSGLGDDPTWEDARKNFQRGWESGLENLVSILETGLDLRIVRRPMLGIYLGDFNAEIAVKLNIPISEGVRLTGVVKGLGAESAGLQENDVLVQFGRFPVQDYASLGDAVQAYSAGDEVEIFYYRGPEKQKTILTLSSRPMPQLPDSPEALAKTVESSYGNIRKQLEEIFQGLSEEQPSQHPVPGEWSAKETLAHLIHSERGIQNNIHELVGGFEPIYDGYENIPARNAATLQAYPTNQALLTELYCLMQETVYFIGGIPVSFMKTKSSYWRLAYIALNFHHHLSEHIEQIARTIQKS